MRRAPRIRRALAALGGSALVLAAVAGVALGQAAAGSYQGTTSQTEPATIVLAHELVGGSTRVVVESRSTVVFTAACVGGGGLRPSPMHLSGVMQGDTFSLKDSHYRDSLQHGGEVLHTVSVHFTVHHRLLSGSFVNRATVRRDGKVLARCTTGQVTLRATRQPDEDGSGAGASRASAT